MSGWSRCGCGVVWYGVVWCGVVRCGVRVVWCGVVWCGLVWYGMVLCGVVRCGVVWCGVVETHAMAGRGHAHGDLDVGFEPAVDVHDRWRVDRWRVRGGVGLKGLDEIRLFKRKRRGTDGIG